ncbi:asparagine synthase (glutamine-hydrolyzing) [Flavobacterium sp. PLA-1-15]|uniref:asparagine synthase (glutamine-hydrolyzing) n=1 Tax=Flavobacterium sp. PLA-1-15 TaxID=3380533 RepID=UPI003B7AB6E4
MCGFLAEYDVTSTLTDKKQFVDLLNLSKKRGPDSQGYWSSGNVQFGFNRLAILDLSDLGSQPMSSPNNLFTVVFNGEIYNHIHLRKKLSFSNFRGNSDTETITACLEEWGIEKTISELDGMFALAIYDNQQKSVTLIRDFAGIKPLFYGWNGRMLVASSQYDQVVSHPVFKNTGIDQSVLKLYLQQHFVPAPFGLYNQTHQLHPGEMITFYPNGEKKHFRYWELSDRSEFTISDSKKAEQYILDTLDSCVQDQMLSDVPLGAFLSGGVDSPLVCSLAKDYNQDMTVFSIGSDSKIHDESERAKQFANSLNLKQNIWKLDAKEMTSFWNEATASLHEPLADFSILPTYLVSKLAKQSVSVALSGDGGDELFFGYERFWSVGKNIKYQHYPSLFRKTIYGFDKYVSKNKKVNDVLLSDSQARSHERLHSRFSDKWLNEVIPDLQNISLPGEWNIYNYHNCKNERELLAKMRRAEFYGMMQKTLRKVDLASMENSLEVRVPFLQKKMIEASLQIDPMLSYGNGNKKQVLKNILHTKIPQVKDDNVKRGFSIPLSDWIRQDLKGVFQNTLLEGNLSDFGFDKKAIQKMLETHNSQQQDLKWALFTLYSLVK